MKRSNSLFDILLTALAPIAWGTTYVVATEFLPPGHPLLIAALRSLPIGILLTIALRHLPQGIWWWRIIILGGLNIGIFQALLFIAAYRLPGGVAATAGAIQPLLVVLFAWLILNEKPSKLTIYVGISGFLGVGLLVLSPGAKLDWIGILAALAGAVSMGLGTVLTKRWKPPVPVLVFTAWQLVVGGALLFPIALMVEGPFTYLSRTNIQGLIYLGVIGTGLAYLLWFRGIAQLKASAVSYLGLISPVMATMIGFVWLQETLTLMQLIGIAIIFTSVLLGQKVNVSGQQRKTPLYSNGDISNPQPLGNPSRSR
ncbi:EamA family transporter [Roseofilum sp. Guam]|uniref:EamA family transporter n=1 Tax=Roseofilum sp. Guam TaxID=2821502 RepID=UPI001B13CF95|nr:EamA family transporter [Roseofilum sp. Guam]MBP0027368.1 EamA family transporter [Roseofilum sp. Guam]